MRKLAIVGAGVFTVLILLVVSLPFLIPSSAYKQFLENQLETMLGRDVTFETDPKIRFFPSLGIRIDGMTIENEDGFSTPNLVEADRLIVSIKLLPLLSRNIEVSSLEFRGAEIFLEEDASGNPNWTLPSEASDDEASRAKQDTQFDARIPKARLIDSRIVYLNQSTSLRYDVSSINFTAKLEGMDAPFDLTGTFSLNSEAFKLQTNLSSFKDLANGDLTDISLSLESDDLAFEYTGNARFSEAILVQGQISARLTDSQNSRDLLGIQPEQDLPSFGTFTLSSKFTISGQSISLSDLKFALAGPMLESQFEGDFTLKDALVANGTFRIETDDVDRLFAALNPEEDSTPPKAIARPLSLNAKIVTDETGTRISIHDSRFGRADMNGEAIISDRDDKPFVTASLTIPALNLTPDSNTAAPASEEEMSGWSEDPIDLSVLHALDGDLELDINRVFRNQSELRDVQFRSKIRNGHLSGRMTAVTLAGDGTPSEPITSRFSITSLPDQNNQISFSVSAEAFPISAVSGLVLDEPLLYGRGVLDASVLAKGQSLADLIQSSSGTFQLSLSNGKLQTEHIQKQIQTSVTVSDEQDLIFKLMKNDVTAFESFDASGRLQNGIAILDALDLDSPVLKARAAGSSSIYDRTLDFQMVAHSSGIANQTVVGVQTGDVAIPVRINGTWSAPVIEFDKEFYEKLLTSQARDQINRELRNVIDSELEDELDLFIGIATGGRITKPAGTDNPSVPTETDEAEDVDESPGAIVRDLIFGDRF